MRSIIDLFSNSFVGVGQKFPNTWSFIPQVLVFLVPLFGRIVPYIRSRNSEHSPFLCFLSFPYSFVIPVSAYLNFWLFRCVHTYILTYSGIGMFVYLHPCIQTYLYMCVFGNSSVYISSSIYICKYWQICKYPNTRLCLLVCI